MKIVGWEWECHFENSTAIRVTLISILMLILCILFTGACLS